MDRMRRNSFVVAATSYGSMIASRFDFHPREGGKGEAGIGVAMMDGLRPQEVERCHGMIRSRRDGGGDVLVLDVGANIGTHTIPWAQFVSGWGYVLAIEAQERIFYALAGNIVMNNCFNARAIWAAAGARSGVMDAPNVDYSSPGCFGSYSLSKPSEIQPKSIGTVQIPTIAIDDMRLPRLDLLKIDVEGMEMNVLEGARDTVKRCRPIIFAEANFSVADYAAFMGDEYNCRDFDGGMNVLMEPR